jgi:hypothetical protein
MTYLSLGSLLKFSTHYSSPCRRIACRTVAKYQLTEYGFEGRYEVSLKAKLSLQKHHPHPQTCLYPFLVEVTYSKQASGLVRAISCQGPCMRILHIANDKVRPS